MALPCTSIEYTDLEHYPVPDTGLIPASCLKKWCQSTLGFAGLGLRQQGGISLDQVQGVATRHAD